MLYLESFLEVMGQADLLQWLQTAKKTGACTFSQHANTRKLYISEGAIVACEANEPYLLLGQFLISSGRIAPDVLRSSMVIQERTGLTLGRILVDSGRISEEELRRLIIAKAEETVIGLSEWDQGVFRFVPGVEPPEHAMHVELSAQHILLEGARRVDDMKQALEVLLSPDAVLSKTDQVPDEPTLAPHMARLLYENIDGKRTINELILRCRTSRYLAYTFLASIMKRGFVRIAEMRPPAAVTSSRDVPDLVLTELQQLVTTEHYEAALDLIVSHNMTRARNDVVSMLIARAEAGFVATAYRTKTPPDAIPRRLGHVSDEAVIHGDLSPDESFLLELADGSWDIRSLVWISPLRKVQVIRGLVKLLDLGYIELISEAGGKMDAPLENHAVGVG